MSKRSNFERKERDFYSTPESAVLPLIPHLPPGAAYWEPCAGDGALIEALARNWDGRCVFASDRDPLRPDDLPRNALTAHLPKGTVELVITNPPWTSTGSNGEPVISLVYNLTKTAPTWLLLPADFAQNLYFARVANLCTKIVAIGRVSWQQNGIAGKDNCCWYLFEAMNCAQTRFFGRAA